MATSNNRDVKLTLSVETLGEDGIKKLRTDVQDLAKSAGVAAPQFQSLADEIGRLGDQAKAVQGFQQLNDEVQRLSSEQQQVATTSQQLEARLTELGTASTTAAERQRQASQAYDEARAALRAVSGELQQARTGYDANGNEIQNLRQRIAELVADKNREREAVANASAELRSANREVRNAQAAEDALAKVYQRNQSALNALNAELAEQRSVLNATAATIESYGLSTSDLAGSQAALVSALNASGSAAARLKTELEGAAQAQREEAEAAQQAASAYQQTITALNNEIRFRQQLARERQAAAAEAEAAEQRAARAAAEAARAEQAESDRLAQIVIANRKAMQQAALVQLAAENAAIREAAENERQYNLQRTQAAIESSKQAAAAAEQAAQRVSDAFATVGARGVDDLRREIEQVKDAMEVIRNESGLTGAALEKGLSAGTARIAELERELRRARNELTLTDRAADALKNSLGQIAVGNLIADAVGYLVQKVKDLGREFVEANVQAQTMTRALTALYGNATTAGEQIDFLRGVAVRSGVALGGLTDSFVRFSAATKASNIPLAESNALFEAVTSAGATLGLSSERVTLALDALGQMASKGVVSMEELRQQLGDSLPGALSLTAKGLGITDAELIKLVESGRLAARDLFPALTKSLKEMQGETNGLANGWDRLKTALTIGAQNAGAAGGLEVLTLALRTLGGVLAAILIPLNAVIEVFGLLVRGAATVAAAIVTMTNPMEDLKVLLEESAKRQSDLNDAWGAAIGLTSSTSAGNASVAQSQRQVAQTAQQASEATKLLTVGIQQQTTAALANGQAATAQATAQTILGNTTTDTAAKYTQLGVELGKLAERQTLAVSNAQKEAQAAEQLGQAITRNAQLRGEESAILEANLQAANLNVAAAQKEADARQALAATLATELAAKTQLAIEQDGSIEKRAKELEDIKKRLEAGNAEAEQARQAVENLKAQAAAADLARAAYADNSKNVEAFRVALEQANARLEAANAAFKAGAISQAEWSAAQREAATAAALLNDAVKDRNQLLDLNAKAQVADLQLRTAGLEVAKNEYLRWAERSAAIGDETTRRYALIEAKKIEIQIDRLKVDMMRVEAEAQKEIARAQLEDLRSRGELTRAKEIELNTSIKLADIKLQEAKAAGVLVTAREQELERIQQGIQALGNEASARNSATSATASQTGAINSNTSAIESNLAAREKSIALAEKEQSLAARAKAVENARRGVDANGFTLGTDGKTINGVSDTWLSIMNTLKNFGIPESAARDIAREFTDSNGNVQYANNPGQMKYAPGGGSLGLAVQNAASQWLMKNPGSMGGDGSYGSKGSTSSAGKASTSVGGTSSGGSTSGSTSSSGGSGSSTRTIVIQMNGVSRSINVASESDAANLEAIIKQLAAASGTST
jgi:tape measure domain-containing protein